MKHIFKFLIVFFFSYHIGRAQTPSKTHTVKKGESVYKISRKYYVSMTEIFDLNPGSRGIIKIGQVLVLPENAIIKTVPSAGNTVTTDDNTIIYKVKRGDTKSLLARRFGLSIAELERQNPRIVRMLLAGEVMQIKGSTLQNNSTNTQVTSTETTDNAEPVTPPTQPSKFVLHLVQKGETLWGLARDNNISVNTLRAANTDLLRGVLKAGQDLRIPSTNDVATITSPTSTTVEEVTDEVEVTETNETTTTSTNGYTTYIVQKGDTKFGLANRVFNTTIRELERLNPKIKRMLIAGQEITVPSTSFTESSTPVVSQTETEETPTETEEVSTPVETETTSETTPVEETPTPTETEETPTETEEVSTPVETVTEETTTEETTEQNNGYSDYTIKPKETLYGLARKAGMPIKDFLELNPQLAESVNTGTIIKMPNNNNTTVTSEAIITSPTASELLSSKHANLTTSLDISKPVNLIMVLPFSPSAYNSYASSSIDFHRVLDDHTKNHLEFYRGARIAIDSITNLGVNLNMSILDDSVTKFDSQTQTNASNNHTIIIAPYYDNEKQKSLDLITNKNATIVTGTSELSNQGFTNIFEALPSINAQRLKMLNYMDSKNGNIIVINDAKREESRAFIAANTNNARFLDVKKNGTFSNDDLIALIDSNRKNFVIIDSEKNNTFLSTTNILLTQLSKNDIQVAVLDASLIPDNTKVSKKRFSILKMLYPSLATPYKTISYIKFINKYTKEYGSRPPENALIGFDITFDTLLRLSQAEDFKTTSNIITEYLTLKFNYKQYASGNYYNDGIYILYYDTSDAIKEAE